MSRGRQRLREVKDATKALQPAATKAASVRIAWRLPSGEVRDVSGVPGPEKPAVQIELDGRVSPTPPAWLGDEENEDSYLTYRQAAADAVRGLTSSLPSVVQGRARPAGPDLLERRQHLRTEPIPAGWEVCVDSPDRLHVMLKRTLLPDPNRPRGQRPWPLTESDQREAARRYVAEVEAGRRTAHWDHEELLIMAGLYQERDPSRGIPLHEVLALADPPPPPPLKPWQKGYFSCGGRYR